MAIWSVPILALALAAPPDPAAQALLDSARRVEARGEALSRVWPGYWPPDQAFVLYQPGTGAAFGGSASPGGASFRPGALVDVRFAFVMDYPSGAANTVLLRVEAADDDLATLFHEQFHDYQTDAFRWVVRGEGGGEFVDLSTIPDLEDFTIAVEQERRLLSAALGPMSASARRARVHRYLAARDRRLATVPAEIRVTEDHREWTEGTAKYAALGALAVMNPRGRSTAERIREQLRRPLLAAWGSYVGAVFRGRAYGVGAGQAWLLDALALPDWRGRVERGEPLAALLAEAAGARPATTPTAEPISRTLRDSVRRQLAGRTAEPVDAAAFLAREPDWLVITFDGPVRQGLDIDLNFSARVMTPLPGGALALQDVREVLSAFDGARVEAHERPVLILGIDGPTRRLISTLYIALAEGERDRIEPGQRVIDLDGVHIELPPHAVIEDVEGRRTIRVVAP